MVLRTWVRKFFVQTERRSVASSPAAPPKPRRLVIEELEGRAVPASSISIANASVVEGDAGSALMKFTVSRIGDLDTPLTVSYATADNTAIAGIDYTATSGKIDIPAGSASGTIAVPVGGDMALEANRTFALRLTDVSQTLQFESQGSVPSGATPLALTLGDVNGDGKLDLVISNSVSNNVSVVLNTTAAGAAAPSFATPQLFATKDIPRGVSLGDVNGDGKPDLVVANSGANCISVLLNTTGQASTTASFATQQTFATGGAPNSVAINDLNGDGKPDLAVANQSSGNLSVLLSTTAAGSSTLSFTAHQTFATRTSPGSISVGDINGDGKLDLAVANMTANSVSVLLNNTASGSATPDFSLQNTFDASSLPFAMALTDVNGDGKLDLAVANGGTNSLSVMLNQTTPGSVAPIFAPQQTFATGPSPRAVVAGDVNSDGKPDLVVTDQSSGAVSVLFNLTTPGAATPNFAPQQTFNSGTQPFAAALGDLNGDGKLDLAVSNRDWNSVSLLVNNSKPSVSITNDSATGTILDDDAPSSVQTSSSNATAQTGSAFTLPTITIKNAAGNPVQNATVVFTVNSTVGAAATFVGNVSSATVVTGADGVAKPPTLTANNFVGAYSLGIDARNFSGATAAARAIILANTSSAAATTTTLVITPSASTGGQLVTFIASVSPAPGDRGAITFRDNGAILAANVPVISGFSIYQTSSLAAGAHSFRADYSGATGYTASTSNTVSFVVAGTGAPGVLSVTPNGNIPSLAGNQRSRIASLVVAFDQPTQLDTNALTLALHKNNVTVNGALQPLGYGSVPISLSLATTDNVSWILTFSGNLDAGSDGFNSLKDGVYDLNIDAAKVHPLGAPGVNMSANRTITFHRLFGDNDLPSTPSGGTTGVDFAAVVNTGDNFAFRNAFNKLAGAGYQAFLDSNGDGTINSGDNFQFRARFNKALTWRA